MKLPKSNFQKATTVSSSLKQTSPMVLEYMTVFGFFYNINVVKWRNFLQMLIVGTYNKKDDMTEQQGDGGQQEAGIQ